MPNSLFNYLYEAACTVLNRNDAEERAAECIPCHRLHRTQSYRTITSQRRFARTNDLAAVSVSVKSSAASGKRSRNSLRDAKSRAEVVACRCGERRRLRLLFLFLSFARSPRSPRSSSSSRSPTSYATRGRVAKRTLLPSRNAANWPKINVRDERLSHLSANVTLSRVCHSASIDPRLLPRIAPLPSLSPDIPSPSPFPRYLRTLRY